VTPAALGLVLLAACAHATWNLLAKRVGGGVEFLWLFTAVSTVTYAPLAAAILVFQHPVLGPEQLLFFVGSTILQLIYFVALQTGYRSGDLSLVYPLARGTGPMLAATAAIVFFGERPTPVAMAGIVLLVGGVLLLAGNPAMLRQPHARRAAAYALVTGCVIAAYTLWDKYAVSVLLIPPLLYDWGANVGRTLCLAPLAARRWPAVRTCWAAHRAAAIGVGVLSSLAYILVLTALVFTRVSYIAPAREISILIGTVMGARLLAEGDVRRRLAAGAAMLLGLAALAVG